MLSLHKISKRYTWLPYHQFRHSGVIGVLVALFAQSPLPPSPEIVHQSSDVGAKHPTDIAVGPEADGENNQDEAEVEYVATEPGDVTTDAGCNGVSLLHPLNTQY